MVFPDFDKPFLLETDASKEGLGAVLSQKQDDGHYHPIAFGSCSLTPLEKNYHSSKLEFLAFKWSVTEHFKEYLTYAPFMVWTDNNPLRYVLTTPNLNATGHRWVGILASYKFTLEYQKEADNGAADALSWVPILHKQPFNPYWKAPSWGPQTGVKLRLVKNFCVSTCTWRMRHVFRQQS